MRRDLGWVRVGVQPARVGQHVRGRRAHAPLLPAERRLPVAGRGPPAGDPAEGDRRRSQQLAQGLQSSQPGPVLLGVELGGPDRRPLDEIGEARAVVAEGVPGVAVHRCDAGRQGRRPEPVAGPGVGDPGVGGVQARVQAAHQQAQAPAHDVGQRELPGGDDLDRVVGDGEGVDGEPGPVQEPGEGLGLPPGEQAAREVVVLVADLLVDPTLLRTEHGELEAPAHRQGPVDVTEGGRQVDGRHVLQALPGPDAGEAARPERQRGQVVAGDRDVRCSAGEAAHRLGHVGGDERAAEEAAVEAGPQPRSRRRVPRGTPRRTARPARLRRPCVAAGTPRRWPRRPRRSLGASPAPGASAAASAPPPPPRETTPPPDDEDGGLNALAVARDRPLANEPTVPRLASLSRIPAGAPVHRRRDIPRCEALIRVGELGEAHPQAGDQPIGDSQGDGVDEVALVEDQVADRYVVDEREVAQRKARGRRPRRLASAPVGAAPQQAAEGQQHHGGHGRHRGADPRPERDARAAAAPTARTIRTWSEPRQRPVPTWYPAGRRSRPGPGP